LSKPAADARLGACGPSLWLLVAALAAGCVRYDTQPLPPFDPAATFVAHSVHGGPRDRPHSGRHDGTHPGDATPASSS
jgi:hypothetical protein